MFKKLIISAFAAIAMMVGMQAPASAAMAVAKPAATVQSEAAAGIVKVGGRRGGFRIRFRHGRRWHHRHYWYPRHYHRRCHWHRHYRHCHWRRYYRHRHYYY